MTAIWVVRLSMPYKHSCLWRMCPVTEMLNKTSEKNVLPCVVGLHVARTSMHDIIGTIIGVRDGGQAAGGQLPPPPIRAVCRHEFGQRVDIIREKHNTCLNNTLTKKTTN